MLTRFFCVFTHFLTLYAFFQTPLRTRTQFLTVLSDFIQKIVRTDFALYAFFPNFSAYVYVCFESSNANTYIITVYTLRIHSFASLYLWLRYTQFMPYDNFCFLDHAFSLVFQFNIFIDSLHSFEQNLSLSVLVRLITSRYIDEKTLIIL